MYGLVNKAIQDLAVSLGGEALWDRIRTEAGLETLSFVSLDSYPDDVTYSLVGAAAAVLELTPEAVLEAFGEHWVKYTAQEGYGSMMLAYGHDSASFLKNLDQMHSRVRLTMPQLRPPSFEVEERGPGEFALHYRTHRAGLAPMVVGLLRGVGALFGDEVDVRWTGRPCDDDHDVFEVRVAAAVRSE